MPQPTVTYRVLIASPSDTAAERDQVAAVLHEWNALHTAEYAVVFLPLRWETHSSPELGQRPQAIINRQVVDACDLLIGVFWTRLGTPTGEAESGTIEEIERCAGLGKPVLLYFRQSAIPQTADLEQFQRLQRFKNAIRGRGLVESYDDLTDLREKLSRHLLLKTREAFSKQPASSAAEHAGRYPAKVDLGYRIEMRHELNGHVNRHDYQLQITVENGGERTIKQWHLDVEIPEGVRAPGITIGAEERNRRTKDHFLVRINKGHESTLYPGDKRTFTVPYMMDDDRYDRGEELMSQRFRATLYVGDTRADHCERTVAELTNF